MRLAPPPTDPSSCYRCGSTSITRHIVGPGNRKGNAGRPYYRCDICRKFLGFVDSKGNDPSHPSCECGAPSKMQVAGSERKVSRGVHFVCSSAKCDFYAPLVRAGGDQVRAVDEDFVDTFRRMGF
ncbi:hypothetical protein QBC47DRAFT_378384 [Echria macrotheca]|uniref:GRF-like zinc ribbon domain-containing protein n=1 Tax=Echria macrotheca TaxID=438768 RepID=A0AAJ0BF15_9PEZI|nr:hypothetical protein QBC47DRAFT_378384 [Echria macrotheca]